MSCRTTAYGSAYTTIARLHSGLSDVQTLSLYHAIRRETPDQVIEVTEETWNARLDITARQVEGDTNLSDARRRSILARLESSRETLPDNDSYRAICLLEQRAASQNDALVGALNEVSRSTGEDMATVRGRFNAYAAEVDSSRSASRPGFYTDDNVNNFRSRRLPLDRATVHALWRVEHEASQRLVGQQAQAPQRITRQRMNSTAVSEAGYDPRGGRLEVVMNSNTDHPYMYRNVPIDVWERMQSGSTGSVFAREVRGNGLYQYRNREEAEAAGLATRCTGCGQYAAAGHTCPTTATVDVPQAPPVSTPIDPDSLTFGAVILDTEATEDADEPAPEPTIVEPAAAPEREPRAEVRLMRLWGRRRHRMSEAARTQVPQASPYDTFRIPGVTDIRRTARESVATFAVQYAGNRWGGESSDTSFAAGSFGVTGDASVRRDGREWTIETRDLRCTCAEYQANYDCEHVRATGVAVRAAVIPTRSASAATPLDPEAAQRVAEEAARHDWTRQDELLAEARQTWATQDDADNYSTNFQSFENDIKLAEERVLAGESAIVYQRENALDGFCPDGGDEGFGVELEFDLKNLPEGVDRYTAIRNIAQELYDSGLGVNNQQNRYHSTASTVHQQHGRGWKFEQDCTVDGEIISPVMRDTPETWENIEKVCEIIKRNGGKATAKTGSHVHVSAPNMTGTQAASLLHTVNQHEDVLYRLSANPENKKHRNMTWCGPNSQIADGVTDLIQVRRNASGHNSGLNLQHVSGGGGDHPELRHWDGTLDPTVIQAQVKMSVGMVKAAERNQSVPATRRKEPVGSHHKRLLNVRGRSRRKLTTDELREDSATMRSFADTLFKRPEDKAQIAGLFAVTKWMN